MLASPTIYGAIASIVLLAAPASARTWAGGVDMQEACAQQYGGGWNDYLDGGSAYDWYCVNGAGERKSINVDAYCSQKYGNAAYADPQGGGAYDWGCYWR